MAERGFQGVLQRLRGLARSGAADATDADLLARFVARRDEAAFDALVRRHGPMAWGSVGACRVNRMTPRMRFRRRFSCWCGKPRPSPAENCSAIGCTGWPTGLPSMRGSAPRAGE
jgi:hypothetical protein